MVKICRHLSCILLRHLGLLHPRSPFLYLHPLPPILFQFYLHSLISFQLWGKYTLAAFSPLRASHPRRGMPPAGRKWERKWGSYHIQRQWLGHCWGYAGNLLELDWWALGSSQPFLPLSLSFHPSGLSIPSSFTFLLFFVLLSSVSKLKVQNDGLLWNWWHLYLDQVALYDALIIFYEMLRAYGPTMLCEGDFLGSATGGTSNLSTNTQRHNFP